MMPDFEERARFERAVRSLPRRTREIYLAHQCDGCSYAEISKATGLNREQVISHMAAAFYHLAYCMDDRKPRAWRWWLRARLLRWF